MQRHRKHLGRFLAWLFPTLIVASAMPAGAAATEFKVPGDGRGDSVIFKSTAKLEFIEGRTGDISGWIECDPGNLQRASAILQVDLRTLKTGINLRDEHMRENHLHTEKFPYAFFKLDSVKGLPESLQPNTVYEGLGFGYFYIHGHRRAITVDLHAEYRSEPVATLKVSASFAMNLDEFKIDRPRALFLKLAETIEVEVHCTATSGTPEKRPDLPDWPLLE